MFVYRHRVRYFETDKMGVAHHSSFVFWFENARIEFLRSLGLNYSEIENSGFNLAVAEINGRFLKPVFFDELIEVEVKVKKFGGAFAFFEYKVLKENGEIAVKGYTKHIAVNSELKKSPLPEWVLEKFKKL